jgi:Na+-driven multidrug efflux pump
MNHVSIYIGSPSISPSIVCPSIVTVSPTLLSLIDTAVVGQVSSVQLAALGPACAICDALTGLMVFISVGTTNAVSTTFGGGDKEGAKRAATVSVVCAFAIGCVVALGLSLSIGPFITRVALPAALASAATRTGGSVGAAASTTTLWAACEKYVRIRALSFPAALVLMSAQASCLGAKDSSSPTLATLLASVVNVVGDAVLVLGPLAMGIAGAAWATVGCQFVAAGMLLRTLVRKVSE